MRILLTIVGLALLTILAPIAHARSTGYAARYRPGLMRRVALNRGMTPSSCMVASHVNPLGAWITVYGVSTGISLRCHVVDIAVGQDLRTNLQKGIIIEVAHENAIDLCGSTRRRPRDCLIIVR
jgi:hypothetical protein